MASIEQELSYDEEEEIQLETDKRVVIMGGEEMEVLDEISEEEVIEGIKPNVRSKTGQCLLCSDKISHPKRHVTEQHLPWYCYPKTACWICKTQQKREAWIQQHGSQHHTSEEKWLWDESEYGQTWVELMNGLFQELARTLKVGYPDGFMSLVNKLMKDIQTPKNMTTDELSLANIFNRINEYPEFTGIKLKSKSVYSLHSLLHWKVLANILTKLTEDQQHWIKYFEEYKSAAGQHLSSLGVKLSGPIQIADAHFHMDTLMARTGSTGFHELYDFGTREFYKTQLDFIVANYCYPSSWPNSNQRTELRKTPSMHFSFGIHPRLVNSSSNHNLKENFADLEHLVKSSKTVAVGECGLDTSDRKVQMEKQVEYLEKQLKLAVTNKLAVVIHCRGDESLHRVLLTSLTNCCPTHQSIHWHCFTSTQDIYQSVVEHFPNSVFGITPFIFGTRYPNITEFIKKNGIDKLVLETDSPYIKFRDQIPNPYVVNFVAEEIAKLINIPIEQVFEATFSNTKKIYGKRD